MSAHLIENLRGELIEAHAKIDRLRAELANEQRAHDSTRDRMLKAEAKLVAVIAVQRADEPPCAWTRGFDEAMRRVRAAATKDPQ